MDREDLVLKVASPTVFVLAMFLFWELACRLLNVPLACSTSLLFLSMAFIVSI